MTWEVGRTYPMRGGGEFHVLEIDGPTFIITSTAPLSISATASIARRGQNDHTK